MKPSTKQFKTAFVSYVQDVWHDFSLNDERYQHEFKTENWFGERMFVHRYVDGQIENQDRYHFDGRTITLFSSEYRYDFGARWNER